MLPVHDGWLLYRTSMVFGVVTCAPLVCASTAELKWYTEHVPAGICAVICIYCCTCATANFRPPGRPPTELPVSDWMKPTTRIGLSSLLNTRRPSGQYTAKPVKCAGGAFAISPNANHSIVMAPGVVSYSVTTGYRQFAPSSVESKIDGGKEATVRANREKALLAHAWNKARAWGYTDSANPCKGVRVHRDGPRGVRRG